MNKRRSKSRRETAVEPDRQDQLGLERLIFFSDAVFAIAITLLTLDIRLPSRETLLDDAQLFAQLIGMWHEYLAYLISFLVIGVFWMAHHRNLLFLMVVAFIPFPSSIISKYSERTATIFYALIMALAGLLLAGIWRYASHRNRLVAPDLDARIRKREYSTSLTTTTIFLVSIGITFWNADIGRLSWLLILPAWMVANRN
jgi:uncharacterized membrane protein